jgi:hypothetical protein
LHPVSIAVTLVVASLIAVVIGNMTLAQGQLHLEQLQASLVQEQSSYAGLLVRVTSEESPANVAREAKDRHLVQPSDIYPIRSVPLSKPLGLPVFSTKPCCSVTTGR